MSSHEESLSTTFDVLITLVFATVSILFLFPNNQYIPLDRRLAGLLGSALCTLLIWLFPQKTPNNVLYDIDIQVLLVLIAIMAINFVIMRQPILLSSIKQMQCYIQRAPNSGFWLVSFISFIVSPFIMNDGLCLLLVTPVLDAFCLDEVDHEFPRLSIDMTPELPSEAMGSGDDNLTSNQDSSDGVRDNSISRRQVSRKNTSKHSSQDPYYFMLAIACSSNIGSATTFSGNPQNIIVAQYLIEFMNCGQFFGVLILPAIVSWLLTTCLLNYFRIRAANQEKAEREEGSFRPPDSPVSGNEGIEMKSLVKNSSDKRSYNSSSNDNTSRTSLFSNFFGARKSTSDATASGGDVDISGDEEQGVVISHSKRSTKSKGLSVKDNEEDDDDVSFDNHNSNNSNSKVGWSSPSRLMQIVTGSSNSNGNASPGGFGGGKSQHGMSSLSSHDKDRLPQSADEEETISPMVAIADAEHTADSTAIAARGRGNSSVSVGWREFNENDHSVVNSGAPPDRSLSNADIVRTRTMSNSGVSIGGHPCRRGSDTDTVNTTAGKAGESGFHSQTVMEPVVFDHIPVTTQLPSGSLSIVAFAFFILLIILEFLGYFSLASIFVLIAICLVGSVLLINYYRGHPAVNEVTGLPYTNAERIAGIAAYTEELFLDLDYNILIIFTGLFIVSGSFVHTGIPSTIWKGVAGSKPFRSPSSLILISIYVALASQLVGNVAVVYMAQDEVSDLSPDVQKLGWCILAWVSTIAGNLTLTGSAANIIVAEKAVRHKQVPVLITPVKHFQLCGLVTVVCIAVGVVLISLELVAV